MQHINSNNLDNPHQSVYKTGHFTETALVHIKNDIHIHIMGIWFDANFSFADHVRNVCKTCFIQMRDVRWVRQYLTDEAAVLATNALFNSRVDYYNSLF